MKLIRFWRNIFKLLVVIIMVLISFSGAKVTPEELQDIVSKLNYIYSSGIMVQIYPTPLGAMATGQGLVFIDPSFVENESYEAVFGVLAHEWAHEVLGHIPQVFLQQWLNGNNVFETNLFNQQKELEADYYAGRALKIYNLPLQPFLDLIIRFNVNADYTHPYLRSHPSTPERIQAATRGYNSL